MSIHRNQREVLVESVSQVIEEEYLPWLVSKDVLLWDMTHALHGIAILRKKFIPNSLASQILPNHSRLKTTIQKSYKL